MKTKIVDITPLGWSAAEPAQRKAAVAELLTRAHIAKEVHVTLRTLKVGIEEDMSSAAVQAVANMVARAAAAPTRVELDLRREIAALCCGDNSCQCWPEGLSKGMATNGGCRCFRDLPTEYRMKANRMVQLYKQVAAQRAQPETESL